MIAVDIIVAVLVVDAVAFAVYRRRKARRAAT
jgi:hypothetical protein